MRAGVAQAERATKASATLMTNKRFWWNLLMSRNRDVDRQLFFEECRIPVCLLPDQRFEMSRQLLAQLLDILAVFFATRDRHFLVPKNEFVSDCNKCIANGAGAAALL